MSVNDSPDNALRSSGADQVSRTVREHLQKLDQVELVDECDWDVVAVEDQEPAV